MLEHLKRLNPDIPLYHIHDPAFHAYGSVIGALETDALISAARAIILPEAGSLYTPSEPTFERLAVADAIRDRFFGTLPTQVGYCCGHSNFLNAAEWHASNEINVAVTPLVLILGERKNLKNGRLDSRTMQAFYVPAGTAIEVYATTLHFCPCEVMESGFGCVVALPKGTNTPLDSKTDDPLLFRKNKWIVAHDENDALILRGVVAGIEGPNYEIRY